jgi:hypothetical protein
MSNFSIGKLSIIQETLFQNNNQSLIFQNDQIYQSIQNRTQ